MRSGRPSWSAEAVASVRAAEISARPAGARVFEDPIAGRIVQRWRFRLVARWGPAARLSFAAHQLLYDGLPFEVLARARYASDRLADWVAGGARQVVVFGAGWDATAWLPGLPREMAVFEVDHPDTQRLKRRRLDELGLAAPPGCAFVPVDLAASSPGPALTAAGFDPSRACPATLLGVSMYLPALQVERLIGSIGGLLARGSELVLDHLTPDMLDPARSGAGVRRAARRLARQGEPYRFAAQADEMAGLLARSGLRQVESLGGAEMTQRWFAPLGDARRIVEGIRLVRATVS